MKVKGGEPRVDQVQGPDNTQSKRLLLERLVAEHQASLLRTCYLYLRDRMQAEDAVQETFLKAWRSLDNFRGDSSEKTWLLRIAVNTCHDMRKAGWHRLFDRRITPEMLPDAGEMQEEYDDSLLTTVMNLSSRLREVVLLYYYHNLNTMEIADVLGIARSSVSARLQQARARLRTVLERMEADE
jgi:RNA polymerase sigma-70 factor (ECF subfamily)